MLPITLKDRLSTIDRNYARDDNTPFVVEKTGPLTPLNASEYALDISDDKSSSHLLIFPRAFIARRIHPLEAPAFASGTYSFEGTLVQYSRRDAKNLYELLPVLLPKPEEDPLNKLIRNLLGEDIL